VKKKVRRKIVWVEDKCECCQANVKIPVKVVELGEGIQIVMS
jgi:hypothetical protein